MALACQVVNNATAARSTALQALAAVESYFSHNGSANWCSGWTFDEGGPALLPDAPRDYNSYTYQCWCVDAQHSVVVLVRPSRVHTAAAHDVVCFVFHAFMPAATLPLETTPHPPARRALSSAASCQRSARTARSTLKTSTCACRKSKRTAGGVGGGWTPAGGG
jgi:hypothetical protein